MRLAVLASGSGTNLQALLDTMAEDPDADADVVIVGSDRPDAGALDRARAAGIATISQALDDHPNRAAWEAALVGDLRRYQAEAVVLAGFMKILGPAFLREWPDRVVNTHPSLLPAFPGAHAVRDALEHGVKVTGCTVHLVDEQVDHGPIIAQRAVEVFPDDSEDSLHERIKAVEHELLPYCVRLLTRGLLVVEGRHVRIRDPEETP